MKLLILGDIHGNIRWFKDFFHRIVSTMQPDLVFQVGDFSLSWTGSNTEPFFDQCAELAAQHETPIYFLDGNHENFDKLYDNYVKDKWDDFTQIRKDLLMYVPRGHAWEWDGVKFMAFGGAYSVNKAALTPYITWFPQEMPTQEEVDRAKTKGKVDVLFTHDVCKGPKYMDFVYGLQKSEQSDEARRLITQVIKSAQPKLNIHGHHHVHYKEVWPAPWGNVQIIGLDADYTSQRWGDCYWIIDTEHLPWMGPSTVLDA